MANPNPVVVNGDTVLLSVVCYDDEQVSINRFGYLISGVAGGTLTLQDCVDTLDAPASTQWKGMINNQATYRGVMGSLFIGNRLTPFRSTIANAGPGTAGADALPRQTCGMFTKVSAVPGPAGRGRVYVPFPAVADNGAGPIPNAGYMTRLGVMAGVLKAPLGVSVGPVTATMTPVIVRYPRPSATPPVVFRTIPWADATARQKWATQRRRGSYGRPNVLPF